MPWPPYLRQACRGVRGGGRANLHDGFEAHREHHPSFGEGVLHIGPISGLAKGRILVDSPRSSRPRTGYGSWLPTVRRVA
jgi:hypothetical protein